jgi:outer membrane protein assembly factor BamE (lipoprotein component of BamABCDE complex)
MPDAMKPMQRGREFSAWAGMMAMLLVAGCASYSGWGLKPGMSTLDEVRRIMGEPAKICPLAGGGQNLIYPRGPAGLHTFNVKVDRDGVLGSIENVLEERGFALLRKGTSTRDDVLCIFGPPYIETYFKAREELVWDFRFRDAWGYPSRFHLLFNEAGVVTGTLQIREDTSGADR